MMYAATRDHMAYKGGIWDCPPGQPNHAVKCIGYGYDAKAGNYITCVNSWNIHFGEKGLFRMKFPGTGCLYALLGFPVKWEGKNEKQWGGSPKSKGPPKG